ncbi:tRNA(Ile)-lysidine synthase [Rickettsiales endosymbiont of Paramecium tredecaurelia]|uniref:tRNA lysidine(34) synthetase TilS n=1 Tax=Candidatus Sarmatiella mevalonica TaxID=2770581 RepID=UPI0019212662|nr:tRNA lysidine(34) synthetase TilS [Candidatus Sarmatiella mevalonica]MBL3284617.1 tRNA(Ile)-lysidine synthase [Candidatus Sarmatiella mevalonica]
MHKQPHWLDYSVNLLERLENNLVALLKARAIPQRAKSSWMLAISGGSDSLALLLLSSSITKKWGVRLVIANVNHQLREESAAEAEYVRQLSRSLEHECVLLKWDRAPAQYANDIKIKHLTKLAPDQRQMQEVDESAELPTYMKLNEDSHTETTKRLLLGVEFGVESNLQAKARQARYALLLEAALDYDCDCIFTAHHQDDIIENLLIRNARKSGILGLSSNYIQHFHRATLTQKSNILSTSTPIIRPLYNFTKLELQNFLNNANIKWMEDLSNDSEKYQRNKIRRYIQKHKLSKLLSSLQKNINLIANKLNEQLITFFAESVAFYRYGFVTISRDAINQTKHDELLYYLFNLIFTSIGGKEKFSRGQSMTHLLLTLRQQENFHKTLGGCNIVCNSKQILIYREFGKHLPQPIIINSHSQQIHWDNRFIVKCITNGNAFLLNHRILYISHLTNKSYQLLKKNLCIAELKALAPQHWHRILLTLPAVYEIDNTHKITSNLQIYDLKNCIALPHLLYYDSVISDDRQLNFHIFFKPKFLSRFIHFEGSVSYEE